MPDLSRISVEMLCLIEMFEVWHFSTGFWQEILQLEDCH